LDFGVGEAAFTVAAGGVCCFAGGGEVLGGEDGRALRLGSGVVDDDGRGCYGVAGAGSAVLVVEF